MGNPSPKSYPVSKQIDPLFTSIRASLYPGEVQTTKRRVYRAQPLENAEREEHLLVHQRRSGTHHMEHGVADSAAHERDFRPVSVRQQAADHRRQYVTVQECAQNTASCRLVPVELAVLNNMHLRAVSTIFPGIQWRKLGDAFATAQIGLTRISYTTLTAPENV